MVQPINILNNSVQGAGKVVKDSINGWVATRKMLPKIGLSAAIAFASGGTSELLKHGINLLVGSFFGKLGSPTTTTQDLRIKTNGTATFTGEINTLSGTEIVPLGNIVVPGSPTTQSDNFLPSYNEPLGVWNLKQAPVIKMSDMIQWQFVRYVGDDDFLNPGHGGGGHGIPSESIRDAEYKYYRKVYLDESSVQMIFNESTKKCIEKYDIHFEIVNYPLFNGKSDWRDGYKNSYLPKIEGELIFNDKDVQILRNPRIVPYISIRPSNYIFRNGKCLYNPNIEYDNGVVNANYVVKITVIVYPKQPYNTTPIVMTRSYLPKFEIIEEYDDALRSTRL